MKPIVSSKGQVMPKYSDIEEDYICLLTLSDHSLMIEIDEYLKEKVCLYNIPLRDIIEVVYVNKDQQKRSLLKSFWINFVGIFAMIISGGGLIYTAPKVPDVLCVSFYDGKKNICLIFNMMEFGENGLAKKYKSLVLD